MLFNKNFAAVLLGALVAADHVPVTQTNDLVLRACANESTDLHCYNEEFDTPQDVDLEDVFYIATYLRDKGRETEDGRFFVMTTEEAPDCGEWLLYARNTAAAYAKKTNMTRDTSVLFEDLATTIDGGEHVIKVEGIHRCLSDGGSFGVQVNSTNSAYNSTAYEDAGYIADGIIVKIVANTRDEMAQIV